jgi:hypothetical protein
MTWRLRRERDHVCAGCGCCRGYEVDHVVAIADGGSTAYENLQLLCRECHARKTATEAAQRALEDPVLLGLRRLEVTFGRAGYWAQDAVDLVRQGREGLGMSGVEKLARGLRLRHGVLLDPAHTVATLVRRGEAFIVGEELRLTEHGRFVADALLAYRAWRQESAVMAAARKRDREHGQARLPLAGECGAR